MKSILFLCEYGGSYSGNFIPTLKAYHEYIGHIDKTIKIIYAFRNESKDNKWLKQMEDQGYTVYFYESALGVKQQYEFLKEIIKKENVTVIHTHFEAMNRALLLIKLRYPSIIAIKHIHSDFSNGGGAETRRYKENISFI